MIIFAGTQGYLDDLPVEQCRKFEAELYKFVDNSHRAVLDEIRTKKALDDALRGKRSADEGVEIARAALPAAAIEEHEDGRLGRVARPRDIEPLSRPLAIGKTAVLLPCAGRFPEIEQVDR